ncbi:serine hydrolase domain-containing protein [Flagellimonas pacifica]|uniref:CubicO group peptidase, beta-lactamase class C family n=1 Tax=Flagellimonas pacifica TaxID=1247520 RepID=A0A285MX15_9FLAO|nr:serine hydrolase domain-containing protein [Allomuricauda parva]SNZ00031.1 CubicO group peptidase, beta-lactamase class C family [Allomuricauda parva]
MKTILILIGLLAYCSITYGQINKTTAETLTQELNQIYSQGHITGFSVSIVNQDSILYTNGFGFSNAKVQKPYTQNTIQNIASISKTFIGIALLKAQELGKLNLEDPINKYLPYVIENPHFPDQTITIRHLATHTSSIEDPSRYEKNGYVLKEKNNGGAKVNRNFRSPDEIMEHGAFLETLLSKDGDWYKKSTFLKTRPGAMFKYSNIASGLAAFIIQNATGYTFPEFTKKYIFKPLEMSHSGWSFTEVDFSQHSKLYLNKETELAFYRLINYPDGGLITSSSDLGKYLTELIAGYSGNGKLLSRQGYRELFKAQLTAANYSQRNESVYNDEYNMGIFMGMSSKGQIGHTGGDPGVATHMFFNTETNIGKLLIVNTELNNEGINEFIDIWLKLEEYETKL